MQESYVRGHGFPRPAVGLLAAGLLGYQEAIARDKLRNEKSRAHLERWAARKKAAGEGNFVIADGVRAAGVAAEGDGGVHRG